MAVLFTSGSNKIDHPPLFFQKKSIESMTSKIVSPKENEDLKIFMGRVLTMLGEIQQQNGAMKNFLEERFFHPSETSEHTRAEMGYRDPEEWEVDDAN